MRHCNIRGFRRGVYFLGAGGSGHVVEDNRFDSNTSTGVRVEGDGSVVRRNHVIDTGGSSALAGIADGILTVYTVDVLDNTVSGVLPSEDGSGNGTAIGIYMSSNSNGSVSGNRVRGVVKRGAGVAYGVRNISSGRISLDGNHVIGDGSDGSIGLHCTSDSGSAKDNIINGFATGIDTCTNDGGNVIKP